MKDYIERLNQVQIHALIEEMRITKKENPRDVDWTLANKKLHTYHGTHIKNSKKIESVFTEFEILKIYNTEPSLYDQRRYQNFMISVYGKQYEDDLKKYIFSKNKKHDYDSDNELN